MFEGGSPSGSLNKRSRRRSLWFRRQETCPVCHAQLSNPRFFRVLIRIDEELAAERRSAGCRWCGGRLHRADYPRKPRACPQSIRESFESRFSFCCAHCRRRSTAQSVRFLGRRVYLGWAVVLCSVRHAGQNTAAVALCEALAVPRRTLMRWCQWWRDEFMHTLLWQSLCGRFMPPVKAAGLPADLLAHFTGVPTEALERLLLFLAPLTVGPAVLAEGG